METLKERLMVKIEDAERQKQDWHRAEIVGKQLLHYQSNPG